MDLSEKLNYEIMDMVASIYNLGCWIDDMRMIPPHGVCFRLNCYVYNVGDITVDDELRAEQASLIVKKHVIDNTELYPVIEVMYKSKLIKKETLLRGFKAMWENS